jgi:hypothetical protein
MKNLWNEIADLADFNKVKTFFPEFFNPKIGAMSFGRLANSSIIFGQPNRGLLN